MQPASVVRDCYMRGGRSMLVGSKCPVTHVGAAGAAAGGETTVADAAGKGVAVNAARDGGDGGGGGRGFDLQQFHPNLLSMGNGSLVIYWNRYGIDGCNHILSIARSYTKIVI